MGCYNTGTETDLNYRLMKLKTKVALLSRYMVKCSKIIIAEDFMNTITYKEFSRFLETNIYYDGRWEYFKIVIEMIHEIKPRNVLELGPSLFTVVHDSDIMYKPDIDSWGLPDNVNGKKYAHDATIIPWPIKDKQYDLFIALQVFEHLYDKQSEAFEEAKRIANSIILSLPYKWDCPKDNPHYPSHHMIDEDTILQWSRGVRPQKTIYIPRTGDRISKGPRIICMW